MNLISNYQAEPERLAEMDQECFRIPWKFDSSRAFQAKIFQAWELAHPEKGSCGFLVFYLIPPEIQILRMGVLPENRREGLALEMLKELDQKAILNQSHTLWPDVHVENTPALGFIKNPDIRKSTAGKDIIKTLWRCPNEKNPSGSCRC